MIDYAVKKNGAGTVSGYVWHSYLAKGKAPLTLKYAKAPVVVMDAKTDKVLWSLKMPIPRAIASVSKFQ